MSNILVTDIPAGQTLDMPCNNLLSARLHTATSASLVGNGGKIHQTLFVDAVNWSPTADGSLTKPFQTHQQALNYAFAQAWPAVQLLTAPATYAAPLVIEETLNVIFSGYDPSEVNQPILSGDIIIIGGVGSSPTVAFVNCLITATTIRSSDIATQDISLVFDHTDNFAEIRGFNARLKYQQSTQYGDVVNTGGVFVDWDGSSWAYTLAVTPSWPAGTNNSFWDAGHDTYQRNLTAAAVPLFPAAGSTVFVDMVVPTYTGINDRVSIQVANTAIRDFVCGIHGVGAAGVVTAWLTNLSRVTLDFDEPILLLVHHEQMASQPAP